MNHRSFLTGLLLFAASCSSDESESPAPSPVSVPRLALDAGIDERRAQGEDFDSIATWLREQPEVTDVATGAHAIRYEVDGEIY
ncbi:MAG: hypothetical protein AAF658_16555, partial [Myxococcota bacterium]